MTWPHERIGYKNKMCVLSNPVLIIIRLIITNCSLPYLLISRNIFVFITCTGQKKMQWSNFHFRNFINILQSLADKYSLTSMKKFGFPDNIELNFILYLILEFTNESW